MGHETQRLAIPKTTKQLIVEIPSSHVLLITLNRPKALNAMTPEMHQGIELVVDWFLEEPSLWVLVITGAGRFFSAGADLKAWSQEQQAGTRDENERLTTGHGFGALSRRHMNKPMIAAVNGAGAYGGGVELILNADIVVASEKAKFGLPEVKRGVVAGQGGIPRLSQVAGHQLAAEMLLIGEPITAQDAHTRYRFVNHISHDPLGLAISLAKQITANSPDSVQSTKLGLELAREYGGTKEAFERHVASKEAQRVYVGENIKEGLKAFEEKRKPVWKNSAKL